MKILIFSILILGKPYFAQYSFSVYDISFVLSQYKGNVVNAKGILCKIGFSQNSYLYPSLLSFFGGCYVFFMQGGFRLIESQCVSDQIRLSIKSAAQSNPPINQIYQFFCQINLSINQIDQSFDQINQLIDQPN